MYRVNSVRIKGVDGTLWQRRANGGFLNTHLHVVTNLNLDEVVFDFVHQADNTARGDDFIAFVEVADQFLMLFPAFVLRTNQQEVENQHEAAQEQQVDQTGIAAGAARGGCLSSRFKQTHLKFQSLWRVSTTVRNVPVSMEARNRAMRLW